MELEGSSIVFQVAAVNAGKPIADAHGAGFESTAMIYIGLSFLLHMGIVASLAFFMPRMSLDDSEVDRPRSGAHDAEVPRRRCRARRGGEGDRAKSDNAADKKEGGTGTRAKGEEGSMGNPNTQRQATSSACKGPGQRGSAHRATGRAPRGREFGMIGLLNTGAGGDPNAPTAPWGRETRSATTR